jgi:uncharacterized protein
MRLKPSNDLIGVGPVRTCIGCRRRAAQPELDRVALVQDRLVVSRTAPGRGAWLCRQSVSCLSLAVKKGGFDRALKRKVGPKVVADFGVVFGVAPSNVSH